MSNLLRNTKQPTLVTWNQNLEQIAQLLQDRAPQGPRIPTQGLIPQQRVGFPNRQPGSLGL